MTTTFTSTLTRSTPPLADQQRGGCLIGDACTSDGVNVAPHEECPGWWANQLHQSSGWTCACLCHQATQSWPGWKG